MGVQIAVILKSFLRESVVTIIDTSLNVCKEIFKFMLMLLLLYHFALWSFQVLDAIVPTIREADDKVKPELDAMAHQMVGETYLRIGAPDENLINQRADLLEQLEFEAEFEGNLNKQIRSHDVSQTSITKDVSSKPTNKSNSEESTSFTDLFIAQIERESTETSRPSQTLKTSLGKKSKLRENTEDRPTTTADVYVDPEESKELIQIFNLDKDTEINKDIITDSNVPRATEEQSPSYDEQYDHESFHRV